MVLGGGKVKILGMIFMIWCNENERCLRVRERI